LRSIDDLSYIELRSRLKSQGLLTEGIKSVLVERLKSPNENDYVKFRRIARLKNNNKEDIDDLSHIELRSRLKSQGLLTEGIKSVLVERLKSPNENDYAKFRRVTLLKSDAGIFLRSIDDLSYIELRSRLKSQGLSIKGIKSVLVARLKSPNENDYVELKNDNAENTFDPIDDLTRRELTLRLQFQGLSTAGCKTVLVARLKSPKENDYAKFRRVTLLKNDNAEDVLRSIDDLSRFELRARLKSQGLSMLGIKSVLVERLKLKNDIAENILRSIDDLSYFELRSRLKSQGLLMLGFKSALVERLKSPNENDYVEFRRIARLRPIDDLTCRELASRLQSQGLFTIGCKSVLVERLKSADEYDALSIIELRKRSMSEGLLIVGDKEVLVRRLTSPRKLKRAIDDLTVIELRQELTARGLKLTRTREDYVKRLKSPTESDYRANGIVKEITQIPRISLTNDEESEDKWKLFYGFTSRQLRDMLRFRGLEAHGSKSKLQKRLLDNGYDVDGDEDEIYGVDKFLKEERKERRDKSLKQVDSLLGWTPLKPPLLLNDDSAGKISEELSGVTNTPLENKFDEDIGIQDMRKKRIQHLAEENLQSMYR
jgi:hypothetical protein